MNVKKIAAKTAQYLLLVLYLCLLVAILCAAQMLRR